MIGDEKAVENEMMTNMKEVIAGVTETLLIKKKVKRLTVKEIVEECNITRQAFYYHFEDIPELLKWMLEKDTEKLLEECLKEKNPESGLFHFFSFAINVQPYVKAGVHTNYGDEIKKLLDEFIYIFFERVTERAEMYKNYSKEEREFVIQYHCFAIKGILNMWTEKDTKNLDFIVHQTYLILLGQIIP